MEIGDRIRLGSTGEQGVIVGRAGDILEVALPSGRVFAHPGELQPLPQDPVQRLLSGDVGDSIAYGLRIQALYLKHAYRYDPLSGLSNARIEPTLHQVYVAHTVTQKLQPRMILADEVGLGKTIEAGLIIKELRARGVLERVLIVCPANLQRQWQQELKSKFNEDFEILDGPAIHFLSRDSSNPWSKRASVITSLTFAASAKRADRIVEADWDLVVFDEAHRVRRSLEGRNKQRATQAYRLADDLKELVNGLLLLTATPMQLHPFELYSLIELVEPGLYQTFEAYDQSRRDLPRLNNLMLALKNWGVLDDTDKDRVIQMHRALLAELGLSDRRMSLELDSETQRATAMDALVERHPLAGVLLRNRKAEVGGFTRREPHRFLVHLTQTELDLYQQVTRYLATVYNRAQAAKDLAVGFVMVTYHKMLASSSHAIRQSLKRRLDRLTTDLMEVQGLSSDEFEELREADELSYAITEAETASQAVAVLEHEVDLLTDLIGRLGKVRDSKAFELLKLLNLIFADHPREKVLIFTQFVETQAFLADLLTGHHYAVATFNGRMSLDDKEQAVERFRGPAQILISTEAGGEGRNFQFCHIMVNYDLPWNPMRVEQRIGRLDRIGQTKTVFIYNLACADTVEERVLHVLEHRIGLFEESVGSLDPILGDVERDIEDRVMRHLERLGEVFTEYEEELERRVRGARERERTLADFVLDRASLRRDIADELLGRTPLARFSHLQHYVSSTLDHYGGSLNEHPEGGYVISLSPRLTARLRLRQSTIRGVFDWRQALVLEHLDFFAFGHDLIDRLVDLPTHLEPATTGARRLSGAAYGEWLEVIYQVRAEGVRPAGKLMRHLVGRDLTVMIEELRQLPLLGEPAPRNDLPDWLPAAVQASRTALERQLAEGRTRVLEEDNRIKEEEIQRAERIFRYRQVRLQRLIAEQERWIEEKERLGSDRERRILPARRGRLAKDNARLDRLTHDHEQRLAEIQVRRPGVVAEVLAAGILMSDE